MARKKKLPKGLRWRDGVLHMTFMANGKQVQRSCHTTDIERATFLLQQARNEVFDGRFVPTRVKANLTVSGLMDLWLSNPAPKAQESLKSDRQRFSVIVDMLGGETLIRDLTLKDCEDLQSRLRLRKVGKHTKKPVSATTVNRYMILLKASLRYATKHGHPHQNPMDGVRLDREHPKRRFCSRAQFDAMIADQSVTPEVRCILQVGYFTGMRLRSVLDLTWDRVNLAKQVIVLRPEDNKTKQHIEIPIDDELVPILKAYRETQAVPTLRGRLFTREKTQFSKYVSALAKKLGFDNVTFHAFRGGLVTSLLESGVDSLQVAAITGHKSLQTVMAYYKPTLEAKHNALRRRKV